MLLAICLAVMPALQDQEPIFVRTRNEEGEVVVILRREVIAPLPIAVRGLERLPRGLPVRSVVEGPSGQTVETHPREASDEPLLIARPAGTERISLWLGDLEPHRVRIDARARSVDLEVDPDRWRRQELPLVFEDPAAEPGDAVVHWRSEDGDWGRSRIALQEGRLLLWLPRRQRYTVQVFCAGHLPSSIVTLEGTSIEPLLLERAPEQRIQLSDPEGRPITTGWARLRPLDVDGLLLQGFAWEDEIGPRGLLVQGLPAGLYEIERTIGASVRRGIVELKDRPANHSVRMLTEE